LSNINLVLNIFYITLFRNRSVSKLAVQMKSSGEIHKFEEIGRIEKVKPLFQLPPFREVSIWPLTHKMNTASPLRKMILYVGQPPSSMEQARNGLVETLGKRADPVFVIAKDGPEAGMKVINQRFDAIIIDHKAPRIGEGTFLQKIRISKNTKSAGILVIVPRADWILQPELSSADQMLVTPYTTELLVRALAKALSANHVEPPPSPKKSTSSFAVDARVLNAIIKSTCFVCGQFGIEDIRMLKPEVRKPNGTWIGDIAASIGINSRVFQGMLVLSFDQSTYLKMLSGMLGEEFAAITPENFDAIGELSNMILGNAKSDFTQYDVSMSIPKILEKGHAPETPKGSASILIKAETPYGSVYIEVLAFPALPQQESA
jgi:CheY-specific phosphatase CheX/CheY-like chemotaxis protein